MTVPIADTGRHSVERLQAELGYVAVQRYRQRLVRQVDRRFVERTIEAYLRHAAVDARNESGVFPR